MRRVWGGVLAITGFLACPCHLPLTLPLVLGALGGTGIGSFIGANTGLVYGLFTGYFIVGIGAGIYLLDRKRRGEDPACELPKEGLSQRNGYRRLAKNGRHHVTV